MFRRRSHHDEHVSVSAQGGQLRTAVVLGISPHVDSWQKQSRNFAMLG